MSVQEIRFEPRIMCEQLDNKRNSFRSSQLEDGEIICFQKAPPLGSEEECQYPDVPSFLEYVNNRQIVHFRSLEKPKEDDFCLELLKLHSYDEVTERVARRICSDDPSKIRLTSHNCYSQQPKPHPIKYRGVEHLSDMLIHYNQMSDILYYEVLDIPLPELQGLKNLKIAFHHATKDEVVIHNIILPKQSTVGDMINELKTKVELSHPNAELRLLEIFYHKIYKIFPPSEKIENINDQYWTLRVEEIPEEEKNLGPHDRLIHVFHFTKESPQNEQKQVQNFGEPFLLVIHEGETLAEVKVRMQKKLQVPDEEFSKWKFAFFSLGHPEYLQDSDIVFTRFQGEDVYSTWEKYLGLEHSDNVPNRAYAVNKRTHIPTIARTISLPQIEDIGTISLDDVDVFFQSLSSETPASSAPSRVSKPSKEEIEEALKQIKEALQLPPVQFDNPGRISTIEKALQTLTALDESSGITIDQNAYLLSLTEKFKTLPARASKAIKSKDNLAQKETLRTRLNQNLKSYIANFTVKKAETFQAEQEIQELRSKQKAAKKKKENLATEIKELYKRSLLDKKELDALTMEIPKYEEEAKAGEEEEKALNEEWNNMMDLISSISTNLKFD